MRLRTHARDQEVRRAVSWYREHGRPVDIVIPSYRDAEHVRDARAQHRRDDAQGHGARDRRRRRQRRRAPGGAARDRGIDVLVGAERNSGFAANVNRGIAASDRERDVVVLNSDVEALPGWLECLQYGAYGDEGGAGIVGASCSTRTGGSSSAERCATAMQPEWFDTATASSRRLGACHVRARRWR